MREVADRHPGVRREREARKRGPRHRFWPSAAAAGAAGAAAAVADGDSAWQGSQKLKIGAPKRLFRAGEVAKSGRGHKIYMLATSRSSASGGCYLVLIMQ